MAQIKIFSDTNKGCIFFDGSTVEPKFIGTVAASIKSDESDKIVIIRNDRYEADQVTFRKLFKRLNPTRVQNEQGENLVADLGYTIQEVVAYINGEASNFQQVSSTNVDSVINFELDATTTSILVSDGNSYGVNTLKAVLGSDNLIYIKTHDDTDVTVYQVQDESYINVNGAAVAGGLNDIVNVLNELFTVGPFEQVVIADPYSTMVADVNGVLDNGSNVGSNAIDPIGDAILGSSAPHYNKAGWVSDESLDQPGEYFTFDIRVTDSMGFGFILDQGATKYGSGSYADPATFCDGVSNNAAYGYYWSHWFHSGNKGPWTYYGQRTSSSLRPGWGNFNNTQAKQDYLNDNPVKMKVGIDANGYMVVSHYEPTTQEFIDIQRSSYKLEQGESVKLGIKVYGTAGELYSQPKKHLLEAAAPTMQFRYIESPDGVFNYPLFATAEEANYYDEITNGLTTGSGQSHTHTYADDPTNTTWYMPEASHDASTYQHTTAPGSTTFSGNAVTYTQVTSLTDSDLTPSQFVGSDITQQEGTAVNIQVAPQDVSYSTSVDISPTGSGLVYNGSYLIQGTLADVGSDTTYTVTVTRANSYGSSVGTFTITATNVAPVSSNDTPWTKALDFSGSNEHVKQVNAITQAQALRLGGYGTSVANNPDNTKTADSGYAFPWAASTVFKIDGNNSNQHIWNMGSGAGSSDKNIYLRLTASRELYFGWGRGSDNNECLIHNYLQTPKWYGLYIAFKGGRFSYGDLTDANLANAFDIRMISGVWDYAPVLADNKSTASNWTAGGNNARTDLTINGDFTIGGRGSNRNFHGKVASMVTTTLKRNTTIPTDAEILTMITDPVKWVTDYKVGNDYRYPNTTSNYTNFQVGDTQPAYATQVWLMGDGTSDSYANGIRNYVQPSEQNYTKLQLNSMVSNDIETVNIDGLT